jgi:hypothetical protein
MAASVPRVADFSSSETRLLRRWGTGGGVALNRVEQEHTCRHQCHGDEQNLAERHEGVGAADTGVEVCSGESACKGARCEWGEL